jgi:hypothetical protein
MDVEVIGWALGGYLLCFCTGFAAGLLHKGIIKLAEAATSG